MYRLFKCIWSIRQNAYSVKIQMELIVGIWVCLFKKKARKLNTGSKYQSRNWWWPSGKMYKVWPFYRKSSKPCLNFFNIGHLLLYIYFKGTQIICDNSSTTWWHFAPCQKVSEQHYKSSPGWREIPPVVKKGTLARDDRMTGWLNSLPYATP